MCGNVLLFGNLTLTHTPAFSLRAPFVRYLKYYNSEKITVTMWFFIELKIDRLLSKLAIINKFY